jgi:wobble nucleotide-excising tRNase
MKFKTEAPEPSLPKREGGGNKSRSDVKMWEALEAVHRQKKAGMRFNAYDELFSIRKLEEESLQSLINCVESAKRSIKELRPSTLTLDMLDDELASMALIRLLPEEYSSFTSSLLLMDKLDKTTVHQAFVTEDLQRRKRVQDASGGSQALAACFGFKNKSKTCDFCGRENHTVDTCKTFESARKRAQENALKPRTYAPKANKAQEASGSATGSGSTPSTEKAQRVVEFAGNASVPSSLSSPSPFTPLQLDSDFNWLADTGATSHMTPHRHWFFFFFFFWISGIYLNMDL